mmetsp:Transcript_5515/g.7998  ORF Transcript_5515/g.7998 Transcript_5515/m.7998 type:complete len:214 (+) Transcript_5515:136-777(+)|eukprot:CAMPEP_0202454298 /NCGR_PEP_ID=MMETSP1360-20130828/12076_1 /ASSEMBLY_ACC=CAM_ASM_000848 /TAXON_ID=515479 /ORGANISM="Licmophora paradoxa, Strain CCMP2313" /LENGTH=213 /DNA_ID=CAMNT_0049073591 /DNA_START=83 /DNA_END=724 /DNA_ORIENTATION=+
MMSRFIILLSLLNTSRAWVASISRSQHQSSALQMAGSLHGENSCFLPLDQMDQDYYAPRIIQIAGAYPGIKKEEILAVSSEPSPDPGQWIYDFSDPDGPQLGTVAIPGSQTVHYTEDPIVIIAEHPSLGIELPPALKDAVDLIVMVDRAKGFGERKFLVIDDPVNGVTIGAYATQQDLPEGSEILGQVVLTMIPWLPAMKKTKSGFMEEDEYF